MSAHTDRIGPGADRRAWPFSISVFVLVLIVNVFSLRVLGRWDAPPIPGDTQDYDNIALNLLHGRGFGFCWNDVEWRSAYLAHNGSGLNDGILSRTGSYCPTAYRPPLLPLAIAACYALFGRSFLAWGLINCAFAAAAVAMAAGLAQKVAGVVPSGLLVLLALLDSNFRRFAVINGYLTEGMSCLFVVLFAWALVRALERGSSAWFALSGAALGSLTLLRSIFIVWYPAAALLVLWICRRRGGGRLTPRRFWALPLAAFLTGALLVPLPWWSRNCLLLGNFMPLGTQGGMNLPLGYSDLALAHGGVWEHEGSRAWWAEFDERFEDLPPLEAERDRARLGERKALEWIAANPLKVPRLALLKLVDLWRNPFPTRFGRVLAAFALLAIGYCWRRPECGILWALLGLNSVAVMATYADGVRLLVPVLPILHILVGLGVWQGLVWGSRSLLALKPARPRSVS